MVETQNNVNLFFSLNIIKAFTFYTKLHWNSIIIKTVNFLLQLPLTEVRVDRVVGPEDKVHCPQSTQVSHYLKKILANYQQGAKTYLESFSKKYRSVPIN